jgi:hypothetical protein
MRKAKPREPSLIDADGVPRGTRGPFNPVLQFPPRGAPIPGGLYLRPAIRRQGEYGRKRRRGKR